MSDLCNNLKPFLKKTGFENLEEKSVIKAFIHPSYSEENNLPLNENYERLEFLGDAVLKLIVSDILYNKFPDEREGKLTNIRAILVSDDFLSHLADDLELKKYIKISKALEKDGGRNNPSISACVFEAFLGSLYDCGISIEKISEYLKTLYSKYIDNLDSFLPKFNSKAILQEYTQSINKDRPIYELVDKTGTDNNLLFKVIVLYNNEKLGEGIGKTKKQAEREAAYQACVKLNLIGEKIND